METKIVKFDDNEGNICYGILVDEKHIICACCGGVYEKEEVTILDTFSGWIDFRSPLEEWFGDYSEPADIDNDMGFDPYLGCYTDDC